MELKVLGTVLPVLEITLQPNESIIAEAGELSWLTSSIDLRAVSETAGAKDLWGVIRRAVGGGGLGALIGGSVSDSNS